MNAMHIIAKPALISFWTRYPDAEKPLEAWYHTMKREVFSDFSELRKTFASADYVNGLTVFDIGGNKYRLISARQKTPFFQKQALSADGIFLRFSSFSG